MERKAETVVFHTQTRSTCAFEATAYITPADVSFSNIEVRELGATAEIDVDGFYSPWRGQLQQLHPEGGVAGVGEVVPGKGTDDGVCDFISSGDPGGPPKAGFFRWNIP